MEREATPEQVCHASVRLLMAQQGFRKWLDSTRTDKVQRNSDRLNDQFGFNLRDEKSEYQAHLDRVKKLEEITKHRFEAGAYSRLEQQTATFYRLEAEEWLRQKKAFKQAVLHPDVPSKK